MRKGMTGIVVGVAALLLPVSIVHAAPSGLVRTGCDWVDGPSADTKNSGFIDSNAGYQIAAIPLSVNAGDEIWIEGRYPLTRYFSFQVYDGNRNGNLLDSLPDSRLMSVDGAGPQANRAAPPYLSANTPRQYLIKIRYVDAPLDAAQREPNVLYAGTGTDTGALAKQVLYRIYLPDVGVGIRGNVDLPRLSYHAADGSVVPFSDSPDGRRCNIMASVYDNLRSVPGVGVGLGRPQFKPVQSEGLYPNGDSAYLRAVTGTYSDMAVVRVRMPRYAKLRKQRDSDPQARYWSICQYGLYSTAMVGCIADRETQVDAKGYATIVISKLAQRPAQSNLDNGFGWINWGKQDNALLVLRETLSAVGFDGAYSKAVEAARSSNDDPDLNALLGDWAPQITYCDQDTFAAYAPSGPEATFKACDIADAKRSLLY